MNQSVFVVAVHSWKTTKDGFAKENGALKQQSFHRIKPRMSW